MPWPRFGVTDTVSVRVQRSAFSVTACGHSDARCDDSSCPSRRVHIRTRARRGTRPHRSIHRPHHPVSHFKLQLATRVIAIVRSCAPLRPPPPRLLNHPEHPPARPVRRQLLCHICTRTRTRTHTSARHADLLRHHRRSRLQGRQRPSLVRDRDRAPDAPRAHLARRHPQHRRHLRARLLLSPRARSKPHAHVHTHTQPIPAPPSTPPDDSLSRASRGCGFCKDITG